MGGDPLMMAQLARIAQAPQSVPTPMQPQQAPQSQMFQDPQAYIQQAGRNIPSTPLEQVNPDTGAIESTVPQGRHGRLKRALSDALFALGNSMNEGLGAGILSATPYGQRQMLAKEQLAHEQAASQQIQSAGFGVGMRGAGGVAPAMTKAQAEAQRAQTYSTEVAPAMVEHWKAQAAEQNARAGAEQFKTTPIGLYDSQKGEWVPGASYNQPITITPQLVKEFPSLSMFPQGEVLQPSIVSGLARLNVFSVVPVQTASGPVLVNRSQAATDMSNAGQTVSKPIGGPPAMARPTEVVNPNTGLPGITTAASAQAKGQVPVNTSQALKMTGTQGMIGDIERNVGVLKNFFQKANFQNMSAADRVKLAHAIQQPDSPNSQAIMSEIMNTMTPEQYEAVAAYSTLVPAIASTRQLLANAPMRTQKQYDAMVGEALNPAEFLAGGKIAQIKLKNFEQAFNALKGPMQGLITGTGLNTQQNQIPQIAPEAQAIVDSQRKTGKTDAQIKALVQSSKLGDDEKQQIMDYLNAASAKSKSVRRPSQSNQ